MLLSSDFGTSDRVDVTVRENLLKIQHSFYSIHFNSQFPGQGE